MKKIIVRNEKIQTKILFLEIPNPSLWFLKLMYEREIVLEIRAPQASLETFPVACHLASTFSWFLTTLI